MHVGVQNDVIMTKEVRSGPNQAQEREKYGQYCLEWCLWGAQDRYMTLLVACYADFRSNPHGEKKIARSRL